MLNVLSRPIVPMFVRTPIIVEIEGSATYWQSPYDPGALTHYEVTFPAGGAVTGDTFTLIANGKMLEVFFTTFNSGDGRRIIQNAGAAPTNTYLNTVVVPELKKNYLITEAGITFNVFGNILQIFAPFAMNMSIVGTITSGSVMLMDVGSPTIQYPKYAIFLRAEIDDMASPTPNVIDTIESSLVPTIGGNWSAVFDLAPKLAPYVNPKVPTWKASTPIARPDNNRNVTVKFTEGFSIQQDGSEFGYRALQKIAPFQIWAGGLSWVRFPGYEIYSVSAVVRFFTWQPANKRTDKKAHEYLLFYCFADNTAYAMGVITYEDGGIDNVTYPPLAGFPIVKGKFYMLNVSYEKIVVPTMTAGKKVKSWTLNLYDENGDRIGIEEDQSYWIDNRNCLAERHYFLYENSLGGFDTLVCTQYATHGIRVEKEQFAGFFDLDYTKYDAPEKVIINNAAKRIKVGTGIVSLEEIKYLQEIFISRKVYYCDYEKRTYTPVVIAENSVELYRDKEVYSLTFAVDFLTPATQYNNAI